MERVWLSAPLRQDGEFVVCRLELHVRGNPGLVFVALPSQGEDNELALHPLKSDAAASSVTPLSPAVKYGRKVALESFGSVGRASALATPASMTPLETLLVRPAIELCVSALRWSPLLEGITYALCAS